MRTLAFVIPIISVVKKKIYSFKNVTIVKTEAVVVIIKKTVNTKKWEVTDFMGPAFVLIKNQALKIILKKNLGK